MASRFLLFLVLAGLVVVAPWFWTDGSYEPDWLESGQPDQEVLFFQPESDVFAALGDEIVFLNDLEADQYEKHNDQLIIINNIPFHRYWQLDREDAFAFHPSALGGLLFALNRSDDPRLQDVYEGAMATAATLPNGGAAWYFPKVYPLNRMIGPTLSYSALTQGRILSAAIAMSEKHPSQYDDFLKKTAKAMEYPYREGGVLWNDNIFLEYPVHFAPPEVILNGWIDALLAYGDYARVAGDDDSRVRLEASLQAMADMLPLFDDEERQLSLYSDAAPLTVNIEKTRSRQKFDLLFDPLNASHPAYTTRLGELKPATPENPRWKSPYDTQILSENDEQIVAFMNCNQKYETTLVSAAPFQVRFNTGVYSENSATPLAGGEEIFLESSNVDGRHTIHFERHREKMFCGYPTNFAKAGGENVYHIYHIVGLMFLARHYVEDAAVCRRMLDYAQKWIAYTEEHIRKGRIFSAYERSLRPMNRLRPFPVSETWPELRQWAESEPCS